MSAASSSVGPNFHAVFEAMPGRQVLLEADERFTIVDASDLFLRAINTPRASLVGCALFDLIPCDPDYGSGALGALHLKQALERVVRERHAEALPLERYRLRRRGEGGGSDVRSWITHGTPLFGGDDEVRWILLSVELASTASELDAASVAVTDAIARVPSESLRAVLDTIALQAKVMTGAELANVAIGIDPDKPFGPWSAVGISERQIQAIGRSPRPTGVLQEVAREGRTVRIPDLQKLGEPPVFPSEHPEIRSFLGVPIRFRGRQVGSLFLGNKATGGEFTESDEYAVEMLAARVGGAIEAAHLYHDQGTKRAWLEAVIEQMPEGVLLIDKDGKITTNVSFQKYCLGDIGQTDRFGNPIDFDLRRSSGQRLAPSDLPHLRALDGVATVGSEFVVIGQDGRAVHVLLSAAPVRDAQKHVIGATLFVQDISARKELERKREEWVSMIAHDLRQPVSTLAAGAHVLSRFFANEPDVRRTTDHMQKAAARLGRMIGDLQDASLTDVHRLPIEPEDVELEPLIWQTIERGGYAHVVVEIAEDVGPVRADPQRFEQVLGNLLSNASKYGDGISPTVVLVRRAGRFAVITVRNRGRGIRAEQLPRVFDRFFRGAGAADGQRGLGLGLYLAKGLVEAHGGRIWVESVPGDTTSFHFTLPLAPS